MEALAAATEEEVLRLWQGLGYYSRARHLHETARQVVSQGGFPQTLEGVRKLKGVGDYTAAAIGSMAFGLPAAVVDGNVYRVLARHFGIDTPINSTEGKKVFASMAAALLPADKAADYNQAIMDFGAVQCTPASPDCAACPLQSTCEALHTGTVDLLPVKLKTVQVKTRRMTYFYLRCQGQTAIHRRGAGDIWQGLWEPLLVEHETAGTPLRLPFDAPRKDLICLQRDVRHQLTHRSLHADFYLLECTRRPELPEEYRWIKETELDAFAKSRLFEKMLESYLTTGDS